MQQLSACSIGKNLTCHGINIGGWLEQGFTWNPDSPRNRFNLPVTFNDRANEYQLNQAYLFIEKALATDSCCWDLGGRVDLLWGTDYFFTTALGLETEQDGSPKWNSEDGPRNNPPGAALYGLAMPQLYGELFVPVGNGVVIKAGHFYSILGYEVVPAPGNFFYSHSYMRQYAEPFTHTGYLASYNLTENVAIKSGMTLGSDNFSNPNDNVGHLAGVRWSSYDQATTLTWAMHIADEQNPDLNNTRYVQSIVLTHEICDGLTYVFQSDLGYEDDASFNFVDDEPQDAEWYGISQYVLYDINDCLTAGMRVEWFRDDDHTRVTPGVGSFGEGGNYFEFTAGLNWKPCPSLLVRPELRWDWSNVSVPSLAITGPYNDLGDKNQFTAAIDVIWTF